MTQNYKPTLSGLTEKDCVIKALEEYDNLGKTAFFQKHAYHEDGNEQGVLRKFRASTVYSLYYRYGKNPGEKYPSKAIAGVAYYIQHNRRLGNFSGGLETVVPKLKELDPEGNDFKFDVPYGPLEPNSTSQQYSDIPELERSERIREYKNYTFEEISRVVKQWLLIGDLAHRELDSEILGVDSEYSRGFQSMGILHYLGLRQSFKGLFRERELPSVINELRNNNQDFTDIIGYLELAELDIDFKVSQSLITRGHSRNSNFGKRFRTHLSQLTDTDGVGGTGSYRREQAALRALLFDGHEEFQCGLCLKVLPIETMVAAHIKPRSKCSESERLNPNIVIPMCKMGCDTLYEIGYVIVDDLGMIRKPSYTQTTDDLQLVLNELEGNICPYFNDETREYFAYKRERTPLAPS